MKKRITPIAIVSIFVVMILAQTGISYSAQPAIAVQQEQQDTIPKHKKDTSMKKKKKDKDTTNNPRRDTFPAVNRR